jgi:tetratricopeptide (TPR) repeat protein
MLYQKARRNEEALRICEDMIRAEPQSGSHYLGLGNLNLRMGRAPAAEQAFRRAVELAPDRPESYFALAQFYVQARTNVAPAVALAERAVALAPLAPHYYVLSRAQALRGDLPAAQAAIARACEQDPKNEQYREWRNALAARGR